MAEETNVKQFALAVSAFVCLLAGGCVIVQGHSTASDQGTENPSNQSNGKKVPVAVIDLGFRIDDCYFNTFANGWAVGPGGKVSYTTNAGQTWNVVQIIDVDKTPVTNDLSAVFFIPSTNGQIGWIGGFERLFKTTDGGQSWARVQIPELDGLRVTGVHFSDELNGVVVGKRAGAPGRLLTTSDGGLKWQSIGHSGSNPVTYDGLIGTTDGTVFASQVFNLINDSYPTYRFNSNSFTKISDKTLQFISHAPGMPNKLLASSYSELQSSTDGGITWDSIAYSPAMPPELNAPSSLQYWWRGLALLSETQAMGVRRHVVRRAGHDDQWYEVVVSIDGGFTWSQVASADVTPEPDRVSTFSKPRFYAFDLTHAWQSGGIQTALIRIGN